MLKKSTPPFALIFAVISFIALGPGAALAQDGQASFKFNLFEVEGFAISKTITLDAEFAASNHGLEISAPFKIAIPEQENVTPLYNVGNGSNDEILKISFATGNRETPMEERQLIENIRFVNMTLPLGDPQERLVTLDNLIKTQIFASAVAGYEQPEYIGSKSSQINGLIVVEAVGKYVDPSIGLMLVHIVGYPNPDNAHSVFAVSNIVADKFNLTNYDELSFTGGGTTLASFTYIAE